MHIVEETNAASSILIGLSFKEMQLPCSACTLYRFTPVSGPHSYLKDKERTMVGRGVGYVGFIISFLTLGTEN